MNLTQRRGESENRINQASRLGATQNVAVMIIKHLRRTWMPSGNRMATIRVGKPAQPKPVLLTCCLPQEILLAAAAGQ